MTSSLTSICTERSSDRRCFVFEIQTMEWCRNLWVHYKSSPVFLYLSLSLSLSSSLPGRWLSHCVSFLRRLGQTLRLKKTNLTSGASPNRAAPTAADVGGWSGDGSGGGSGGGQMPVVQGRRRSCGYQLTEASTGSIIISRHHSRPKPEVGARQRRLRVPSSARSLGGGGGWRAGADWPALPCAFQRCPQPS